MKWFNNRKISTKLMVGFIFVSLIAGAVGIVGIINMNNIDNNNTIMYEDMTTPITYTSELSENTQKIDIFIRDMMDTQDISNYSNKITECSSTMDEMAGKLEGEIISDEVRNEFNIYKSNKEKLMAFIKDFAPLCNKDKNSEALSFFNSNIRPTINNITEANDKMVELLNTAEEKALDNNKKTSDMADTVMIVIVASGIVISLLIGVLISGTISRPVKKLAHYADLIADGDLDVSIQINSKDEIGKLADSFKRMSDNLNETMSNILLAANQVSDGSNQLSDSSIALAQGAAEQASSIEELTASIEEVSSQTVQNADNASEAKKLAETAKEAATNGNNEMGSMLKAMEDINESSANISKIIKVIDDIAFQTNILALNAAVEAARAGQYGKGFAVVAEEVRNLAAKSADAAKETTALIEASVLKSEKGTKIANETASALQTIVENVSKSTDLVDNIADASREQSTALSQISQSVTLVSQVVQNNSSTSEESSAASEELAGQANTLKQEVQKFKLRNVENKTSPIIPINKLPVAKKKIISLEDNNSIKADDFGKY